MAKENRKTSDSMLKAIKKYNEKSMFYAVKYAPKEREEGERLKAYLSQTGQSANSYIKGLIKADLDGKGFMMND